MRKLLLFLFMAIVGTFLFCVRDCYAGTFSTHTITHENLTRSYIKFVPSDLPNTVVPLVFSLHGGTGSAAGMSGPNSPWREWTVLAERDKFIVVYPDGVNNSWNDCRSDNTRVSTANDVGFVELLIDTLSSQHNISSRQIYATGTSNGGLLAWRLAFELSHRIAAIAPHIANLPVDPFGECPARPTRPVSVVLMLGDADSLMPYQGGLVTNNPAAGTVRSADDTVNFWTNFLGTGNSNISTVLPNINLNDNSTVTKYEYGSQSRAKITFYRVFGGGHSTPSITFPTTNFGTGSQNRDIETVHEFWSFLKLRLLQKKRPALPPARKLHN
ncbi:MAG: hypothetical protein IPI64_12550 [Chloracidobacterium sp.]|nr:hypothetical protein [Chloracidobacterium sp.]